MCDGEVSTLTECMCVCVCALVFVCACTCVEGEQMGRLPRVCVYQRVCVGFFNREIYCLSNTTMIRKHCHLVDWEGCWDTCTWAYTDTHTHTRTWMCACVWQACRSSVFAKVLFLYLHMGCQETKRCGGKTLYAKTDPETRTYICFCELMHTVFFEPFHLKMRLHRAPMHVSCYEYQFSWYESQRHWASELLLNYRKIK